MNSIKWKMVVAGLGAAAMCFVGAMPANAAPPSDAGKLAAAEAVVESVLSSADPAAELGTLTPTERELFDYYVLPARVEQETNWAESTPGSKPSKGAVTTLASTCGTFTQRGAFYSNGGLKLGEFWTTGQGCRSGSTVTSVAYIDGGGRATGLGWSYKGRTTGKGIINNVGKVYGQYKFELNIGGVIVQSPSYCARTIHTSGASFGDGGCGL